MFTLYPAIKAYAKHQIKVDPLHVLYVEEVGNPDGLPILFLHGGPGAGCDSEYRRFFDPKVYRIVLFDQRGCGRSTPFAEVENNTTHDLIQDIETIRQTLSINKWILFGGSWGATLALLYAEQFQRRVMGMILRGVYLARKKDLDWLYKNGARDIFPDYWEDFTQLVDCKNKNKLITAYYEILHSQNELAVSAAAKAWSLWETRCSTLHVHPDMQKKSKDLHLALPLAKISTHYFINNCFIEENQILKNAHLLKGIPGIIVHGRYDTICPVESAWSLHEAWPQSELHITRDAGHSQFDPSMIDTLIRATRNMAKRFRATPPETC